MAAGSERGRVHSVAASTAHFDRTFFIADLYRLCRETDTLQNALVVYKPEADLRRVSLLREGLVGSYSS